MSEDCLSLNVFVPSNIKPSEKIAVMVWIHGGGFVTGSSGFTPGAVLASFNDVIVVSINYRLGVFGFFNVPGTNLKGNYGMLDQVNSFIGYICVRQLDEEKVQCAHDFLTSQSPILILPGKHVYLFIYLFIFFNLKPTGLGIKVG